MISVIIAVYNNIHWLNLILDALRMQSDKDFEVVIADDGSGPEMVKFIHDYSAAHPELAIKHCWHEDKGWRKNIALNNAVKASEGDYLIFMDGDCIPHPRFVEDHRRLRCHGVVMGGRRVETDIPLNSMLESWKSLPEGYFRKSRLRILSSIFSQKISSTLSQLRRTWRFPFIGGKAIGLKSQGILGANFGLYKVDLEKVNGFDERYLDAGTGEDCDLDVRLEKAGIKHLKASHYALMLHRHHKRLFWGNKENARLFEEAKRNSDYYTPYGLKQN